MSCMGVRHIIRVRSRCISVGLSCTAVATSSTTGEGIEGYEQYRDDLVLMVRDALATGDWAGWPRDDTHADQGNEAQQGGASRLGMTQRHA
jgi:hypothetical protein